MHFTSVNSSGRKYTKTGFKISSKDKRKVGSPGK
jgi:hypothetical protein